MEYAVTLEIQENSWITIFNTVHVDTYIVSAQSAAHAEAIARSGMIPAVRKDWGDQLDDLLIRVLDIKRI